MITIRRGIFETNSSSTHSICITKRDEKLEFPYSIYFKFGKFNWEFDYYVDTEDKASYLYTAIFECYGQKGASEKIQIIKDALDKKGIEYEFEEPKFYKYGFDFGYIDHGYENKEFVDAVLKSDDRLYRYLFSYNSYILTGNDNSMLNVDIKADYPHEEYYKGN